MHFFILVQQEIAIYAYTYLQPKELKFFIRYEDCNISYNFISFSDSILSHK